jgi:hypothetical protein
MFITLLASERPDEELHGDVVDALGVFPLVRVLRLHPSLREDVSHGADEGLEPFRWPHLAGSTTLSNSRCRS